jgi:hypothetical protein
MQNLLISSKHEVNLNNILKQLSIAKINWLLVFKEIFAVYFEDNTRLINKLKSNITIKFEQDAQFLMLNVQLRITNSVL